MRDASLAFAEPQLQELVPRGVPCSRRILLSLLLGLGLAVLVSPLPYAWKGRRLQLSVHDPSITIATRMASTLAHGMAAKSARFLHVGTGTSVHDPAFIRYQLLWGQAAPQARHHHGSRKTWAWASAPPFEPGALSEFVTMSSGVQMPRLIYRTAWKRAVEDLKGRTEDLVLSAVRAGFRGIDTASSRVLRGNCEPGIGAALASLFASGISRDSLFIQAQVNPYFDGESDAPIAKQVELSIASSLSDLGLEYIDSLLLHKPARDHQQTMEAWRAMEDAVRAGLVRQLGIANFLTLDRLQKIYTDSTLKPAVVQQTYVHQLVSLESKMRGWCAEKGVYYQSFGMFSVNSRVIASEALRGLAEKYDVTPAALFFRYAMGLDLVPLIFTASDEEMVDNLSALHVPLTKEDAETIDELTR